MTAYFDTVGGEGFEFVQPVDHTQYDRLSSLDGTSLGETWAPLEMRLVKREDGKSLRRSDFPWLGYGPWVLRPNTADRLANILCRYGEYLPLDCAASAGLVAYNVTNVLDALDAKRSDVTRFSDGRIMIIHRVALIDSVITGADIFRLPHPVSRLFVSQRFVDEVKTAGLFGLDFRQVWPPAGGTPDVDRPGEP